MTWTEDMGRNSRFGSPEAHEQMARCKPSTRTVLAVAALVTSGGVGLGIYEKTWGSDGQRVECHGQEAQPPITRDETTMAAVAARVKFNNPDKFDSNITNRTIVGNSVIKPSSQDGFRPASFRYDLKPHDIVYTPASCKFVPKN